MRRQTTGWSPARASVAPRRTLTRYVSLRRAGTSPSPTLPLVSPDQCVAPLSGPVMMLIMRTIIALILMLIPAAAQDGHFGHGHDAWHGEFYNKLVTPTTKVSCCNLADCRPTSTRQ